MIDEGQRDEKEPQRATIRALTLADVLMQCANALSSATNAMMVTLQYAQEQGLFDAGMNERQKKALDEIEQRMKRPVFMQGKKNTQPEQGQ